jgi:hypothetical protein
MPDQLTPDAAPSWRSRAVVRAAICVAVFVLAGALAGVLWRHLWSPVTGVVQQHQWFAMPFDAGEQHDFNGEAWYFIVALASGIALALVAVVVMRGAELLTLLAVAVGSVAAGVVMWRVGMIGNAPDPMQLAKHAADGTKLSSRLHLANAVALTAFPLGALGMLMCAFLMTGLSGEEPAAPVDEPGFEPAA